MTEQVAVEWLGRSADYHRVTLHRLERLASRLFHVPRESCNAYVERNPNDRVAWQLTIDMRGACALTFSALTKRGVMADAYDMLRRMTVAQ